MADMRRSNREPPAGPPRLRVQPGMAKDLLRELAPLLAEEGIDLDSEGNPAVYDLEELQQAVDRAVERRNLFTPVGPAREARCGRAKTCS